MATKVETKKGSLLSVTMNLKKPQPRYDKMEGRPYLVVPTIMLTEGVHKGSKGPLLYTAAELSKTPEVWNHKPIVVYHPMIDGVGVSACDPDILTAQKVGIVMASAWKGKLSAEAWFEEERLKLVDNRILESIQKGKPMEISTGLFSDDENLEGDWNGEHYVAVVRNIRPDHLAILPDQVGACSLQDGAGLLRNEELIKNKITEEDGKFFVYSEDGTKKLGGPYDTKKEAQDRLVEVEGFKKNEASFDAKRVLVQKALRESFGTVESFVYVEDIFDKFFIYSDKGKLWKRSYSATDTSATLEGEPEEVVRVVQYRSPDGTVIANVERSIIVDKKKVIDNLVSLGSVWVEGDRELLMKKSEEQLEKLLTQGKPVENKTEEPKPEKKEEAVKPITNVTPAPTPKLPTVEEYIANAPGQIRDMLAQGLRAHERDRSRLVEIITGNSKNTFGKEVLNKMDLDELHGIAALARQDSLGGDPLPSFAGLADALQPTQNAKGDDEVLPLPVMNFAKQPA